MRPRDWPQPPQRPHAETLDTTTPSSVSPSTLFHPLGKIGSQPEPFGYRTRFTRISACLKSSTTLKKKDNHVAALSFQLILPNYQSVGLSIRKDRSTPLSIPPQMVGSNYRRIAAVPRSAEYVLLRALIKFRRANNGTGIVLLENRPLSRRVASCR